MSKAKNSTTHSREYIINTLFTDFGEKIDDQVIEDSLIKLGIISAVSYRWLKEHFIDKELSAKECAELIGCSVGHIQGCLQKHKINKKKFGITTGNNAAHRRMLWKRNIQQNQPNRKEVVVLRASDGAFVFECPSIAETSRKLNIKREHVRDCLNPKKQRHTADGFKFMFKKAWDEHVKFMKIKNKEIITAESSYEDVIAIAKADIEKSYQ